MKHSPILRFSSLVFALLLLLGSLTVFADEDGYAANYDNNGDGKVDVSDVTATLNYLSGSIEGEMKVFDDNNDGKADITDVTWLLNYLSNGCGHNRIVIRRGKDPTCTEDGLTDGTYCRFCGSPVNPQKVIPALGHLYDPGTCRCERCRKELLAVGDSYVLGHYEQDGDFGNGAEAITWTVLNIENGRALLLADKVLDVMAFHDRREPTWDESTLRAWLNGRFYDLAFDEEEKASIATTEICDEKHIFSFLDVVSCDKVFLLSKDEFTSYLTDPASRFGLPTDYALAVGAETFVQHLGMESCDSASWWLRQTEEDEDIVCSVAEYGSVRDCGYSTYTMPAGVRPAITLSLCSLYKHQVVVDGAVPVTCLTDGLTEGSHCALCGEVLVKQEKIRAVGRHMYENGVCTACGKNGVSRGDSLCLGSYEQDNNQRNGAEPLEWLVLDVRDGKALVVSRFVLAFMSYRDEHEFNYWNGSHPQIWLNGEFYDTAFTDEERALISQTHLYPDDEGSETDDHLFLLTLGEAESFFSGEWEDLKYAPATPYASDSDEFGANATYFLRTISGDIGEYDFDWEIENTISRIKGVTGYGLYMGLSYGGVFGVRPAMWVDLCAEGHEVAIDEAVPVTCTTDGITEGMHCTRCGEILIAQEVIPAVGAHMYVNGVCTGCGKSAPAVGDRIFFGSYEQDNDLTNGAEPIRWDVLAVEDGRALLVSHYVLRMMRYHDNYNNYWYDSEPCLWLNDEFYDSAFTEDERAYINTTHVTGVRGDIGTDNKIFILSEKEVEDYIGFGFEHNRTRRCAPTPYAVGTNEYTNGGGNTTFDGEESTYYWLRTIADHHDEDRPSYMWMEAVNDLGQIFIELPENIYGVRPAMWIDLCAEGHEVVVDEAVPVTCTTDGLTEGSHCARCGEVLVAREVVPAAGAHKYANGECTVCGKKALEIGDNFFFGRTEQDNDLRNGAEPIEWLVLDIKDGKALVISRYIQSFMVYHDDHNQNYWHNSLPRAWMNGEFMSGAFTDAERAHIQVTHNLPDTVGSETDDRLFLLTVDEITAYLPSSTDRVAAPTPYAKETANWSTYHTNRTARGEISCEYFLRTISTESLKYYKDSVSNIDIQFLRSVYNGGGITDVTGPYACGVRPAMWIDLCAEGHTVVTDEAVLATCTTDGKTEGSHCALCGEVFVAQQTIPAFGHDYTYHWCDRCGGTDVTSEGLFCTDDGNCWRLTAYSGTSCLVFVPQTAGGLPVTSVGGGAFAGNTGLTGVILGANIRTIGGSAFDGCTSLNTVFLPKSLTEIGSGAFDGCGITDVCYAGTAEEWASVTVGDGNTALLSAVFHFGA